VTCVLRALGRGFDPEAFLAGSPFTEATPYQIGQPARGAQTRSGAGFNVTVSEAGFADLEVQIQEAILFLDTHEDELRRLGRFPGVDEVEIDFGIEWRDTSPQTDLFPADLLWRAGALDIGLRITHYLMQQRES
jgi:hypothetical protein